jgi:hypothetical protein
MVGMRTRLAGVAVLALDESPAAAGEHGLPRATTAASSSRLASALHRLSVAVAAAGKGSQQTPRTAAAAPP